MPGVPGSRGQRPGTPGRVAIVGGGYSGAMLAARLAEADISSVLIDAAGAFGLGVAYSTTFDGHLLNVRSGQMSACEGRDDDFVDWLKANAPERAGPDGFAPRRLYGTYIQDRLAGVERDHPGRIERVVGAVVGVGGGGVRLADGGVLAGDVIVLATGNPAPATAASAGDRSKRIVADPWADGALSGVEPYHDVIILGTGLTMVDTVQSLVGQGWRARATVLSRRGLMPRSHADTPDCAVDLAPDALTGPISSRLAHARRLMDETGWRDVMEAYRPITSDLWAQADTNERARLLRHLRPWWDVHRHRIAPRISRALAALQASGRLSVRAGRVSQIEADPTSVTVHWHPRGDAHVPQLTASWLIDCTGPAHSVATGPLMRPLLAAGRVTLDPLGLGVALDAAGRVRRADETADPALFVLGPPARAAYWETVAVPDIRKRIENLVAAILADAKPV